MDTIKAFIGLDSVFLLYQVFGPRINDMQTKGWSERFLGWFVPHSKLFYVLDNSIRGATNSINTVERSSSVTPISREWAQLMDHKQTINILMILMLYTGHFKVGVYGDLLTFGTNLKWFLRLHTGVSFLLLALEVPVSCQTGLLLLCLQVLIHGSLSLLIALSFLIYH